MKLKSKDGKCDESCALWSPLRCKWSGIVDQPLDGCPIHDDPDGEYHFRLIGVDSEYPFACVELVSDCCPVCDFYANCDKDSCPIKNKNLGTYLFALEIL
jgi:hypothetical protein